MANSVFNALGGGASMNGMMQQFNAFRANPMQFLIQRRINLPQQYANDPRGAIQYLMNSGQMNQQTFDRLAQMAQQMGVKFN